MENSKEQHEQDDNLINQNQSIADSERIRGGKNDQNDSNIDRNKPQFERDNLQADKEKRAGSGGSRNPDKNSGDR